MNTLLHTLRTRFTALALGLAAAGSFAQTPAPTPAPAPAASTPAVDARQAKQEQRIDQGVASGALTPREARRLEREQNRVAHAEAKAKADGTVTRAERRKLHALQDGASKDIAKHKHDRQTAARPASAPTN